MQTSHLRKHNLQGVFASRLCPLQTEAMKKEAAASAEAIEAEKAAKWAAAGEAEELQRLLKEANEALAKQREFADRLGSDSALLKDELQAAIDTKTALATDKQGLTQVNQLATDASLLQVCLIRMLSMDCPDQGLCCATNSCVQARLSAFSPRLCMLLINSAVHQQMHCRPVQAVSLLAAHFHAFHSTSTCLG